MENAECDPLEEEVRKHFNEPVLLGFDVGRIIGYAEDDRDCYMIVQHPFQLQGGGIVWHTMVGGYIYLDKLKEQGVTLASNGETWTDYWRLDNLLELNGAPKATEFVRIVENG